MLQRRKYRKLANLTQTQLGELVGATKMTVSNWECGVRTPTIKTTEKICRVLNVTLAQLHGEDDTDALLDYSEDIELADYLLHNEISCINEALMLACTMLVKNIPSKNPKDIYTELLFKVAKRRMSDANTRNYKNTIN